MEECMYLEGSEKNAVCGASLSHFAPGTFERQVYCDTEEHYRCPILLAHTLRKGCREEVVRAEMLCSR